MPYACGQRDRRLASARRGPAAEAQAVSPTEEKSVLGKLWRQLFGHSARVEPAPRPPRNFFVTTTRVFSPSRQLLAELSARRATRGSDKVESEYNAFLLDPGLGPGQYLSSDGRILWDDDGWGIEGTRRDAITAVLCGLGKTKIERLRELLPSRPMDATDCEVCRGTGESDMDGWLPHSVICMKCAGLGWKSPALDLDESILESRRAN